MSTEFIHRRGWTGLVSLAGVLIIGVLAGSLVTAKTGRAPFGMGNTVPILVATSSPIMAGQISFGGGFSEVVNGQAGRNAGQDSAKQRETRQCRAIPRGSLSR